MIPATRIGLALGASVALHGSALAVLHGLPIGFGEGEVATQPAEPLQVRVRSVPEPAAAAPAVRRAEAWPRRAAVSKPGVAPAPVYYPVRELDERPLVRVHVEPQFPAGVLEGERRIALELYIGLDGSVEQIALLSPGPQGPFEQAAVRAFAAARFTPGRKAGVAVRSRMALEVLFGEPIPVAPERAAAFSAPR